MRNICEAYPGVTPQHVAELTIDQVLIMAATKETLQRRGIVHTSARDLEHRGVIKPRLHDVPGSSLVQRIRARNATEEARRARRARVRQDRIARQRAARERRSKRKASS